MSRIIMFIALVRKKFIETRKMVNQLLQPHKINKALKHMYSMKSNDSGVLSSGEFSY